MDNGLYDSAVDTYDGDGTGSYDFSYLVTATAAYEGLLEFPNYNRTTEFIGYSAEVALPTYTKVLTLPEGY